MHLEKIFIFNKINLSIDKIVFNLHKSPQFYFVQ
jgi:hypothetical protein